MVPDTARALAKAISVTGSMILYYRATYKIYVSIVSNTATLANNSCTALMSIGMNSV